MIAKEKVQVATNSATSVAGDKQERDVAFYLRREFKDHPSVFIFNDLKITHNDENAQIDHLILYPYGFILIESKSITGEIKVNKHEEWTRSYRGNWQGMPSPIKQVELQQKLLKELLNENKASILKT
ncbi:NERD domain-containing protein [Shewanella sp. 202IG2-18]|nr:NERD domain-containing protein [Parashewanella hymeniacidonis]